MSPNDIQASPLLGTLGSARDEYSHCCKQKTFQHGRIAQVYIWPQVLIKLHLLERPRALLRAQNIYRGAQVSTKALIASLTKYVFCKTSDNHMLSIKWTNKARR